MRTIATTQDVEEEDGIDSESILATPSKPRTVREPTPADAFLVVPWTQPRKGHPSHPNRLQMKRDTQIKGPCAGCAARKISGKECPPFKRPNAPNRCEVWECYALHPKEQLVVLEHDEV